MSGSWRRGWRGRAGGRERLRDPEAGVGTATARAESADRRQAQTSGSYTKVASRGPGSSATDGVHGRARVRWACGAAALLCGSRRRPGAPERIRDRGRAREWRRGLWGGGRPSAPRAPAAAGASPRRPEPRVLVAARARACGISPAPDARRRLVPTVCGSVYRCRLGEVTVLAQFAARVLLFTYVLTSQSPETSPRLHRESSEFSLEPWLPVTLTPVVRTPRERQGLHVGKLQEKNMFGSSLHWERASSPESLSLAFQAVLLPGGPHEFLGRPQGRCRQ